MGKKTPDQLLYEATRNAAQRPLLNRLEALETTSREQRERIAELEGRLNSIRKEANHPDASLSHIAKLAAREQT
jgi:uncharacterized coiled-coil protein SlyX